MKCRIMWHFIRIFTVCYDKNDLQGKKLQFCLKIKTCDTGRVAQSVTCLSTDACLTADPGVASSILVRSHTFVELDHEMISTVNLLSSSDSFKKGCCQLQAKVCVHELLVNRLFKPAEEKVLLGELTVPQ